MTEFEDNPTSDSGTIAKLSLSVEQLRSIKNFEDIRAFTDELGLQVFHASDLGDGFTLLKSSEKDLLVERPTVIVGWSFSSSEEYGGEFVSLRAVVMERNGSYSKYIVNDGSTGIYEQLKMISREHPDAQVIMANRGFRKSVYTVPVQDPETGETVQKKSTTYYIDTAKVQ